jgi:hypothetical protein
MWMPSSTNTGRRQRRPPATSSMCSNVVEKRTEHVENDHQIRESTCKNNNCSFFVLFHSTNKERNSNRKKPLSIQEGREHNVLHVKDGLCLLERDLADILHPVRTSFSFLAVVRHCEMYGYTLTPPYAAMKTYMRQAISAMFDRLTRAFWPSVTYWDLGTPDKPEFVPAETSDFHRMRWDAMKSKRHRKYLSKLKCPS